MADYAEKFGADLDFALEEAEKGVGDRNFSSM